jgi:hypothetical protein
MVQYIGNLHYIFMSLHNLSEGSESDSSRPQNTQLSVQVHEKSWTSLSVDAKGNSVYTVKKWDNLWSIANSKDIKSYFRNLWYKHDTDSILEALIALNHKTPLDTNPSGNLAPYHIQPDEVIQLPHGPFSSLQ